MPPDPDSPLPGIVAAAFLLALVALLLAHASCVID